MKIVDKIAKNIAKAYLAVINADTDCYSCEKNKEFINDIRYLKELKQQLVDKETQIKKQDIEWDRTFDSIIDNIVIINRDMVITKTNKNFIDCMSRYDYSIPNYAGILWTDVLKMMGDTEKDTSVVDCIQTGIIQESHNQHGDKKFYILVNPIFNDGIVIGAVRISRDISKIEKQKNLLQEKNVLLQSIVEITHELESNQNFDIKINNVLRIIAQAVGADRSYIYYNKTENGRLCATFGHEWCSDNFEKCNTAINDCVNFDILIDWRDDFLNGKTITGNTRKCTHCPNKNECEINKDGKFSVCAVPIFVNRDWIGFIGFDYLVEKKFIDDEEYILRVAADILGNVLSNQDRGI